VLREQKMTLGIGHDDFSPTTKDKEEAKIHFRRLFYAK